MNFWTTVAFVVGTACSVTKLCPQFVRTAIRGEVAGLSVSALWLSVAIHVLWISYALAAADRRLAAVTAVSLCLTLAIALRLAVAVPGLWLGSLARGAFALLAAVVFIALARTSHDVALSRIGCVTSFVHGLPQLVYLAGLQGTSATVSGVSTSTLSLTAISQIAWMTYWALQTRWLLAGAAGWAGSVVVLTLLLRRRQSGRTAAPVRRPLLAAQSF